MIRNKNSGTIIWHRSAFSQVQMSWVITWALSCHRQSRTNRVDWRVVAWQCSMSWTARLTELACYQALKRGTCRTRSWRNNWARPKNLILWPFHRWLLLCRAQAHLSSTTLIRLTLLQPCTTAIGCNKSSMPRGSVRAIRSSRSIRTSPGTPRNAAMKKRWRTSSTKYWQSVAKSLFKWNRQSKHFGRKSPTFSAQACP